MTKENNAMLKMLLCACLWSIAGIIIKMVDMNSFAIAGFRSLFAAAAVGVFMAVKKNRYRCGFSLRHIHGVCYGE